MNTRAKKRDASRWQLNDGATTRRKYGVESDTCCVYRSSSVKVRETRYNDAARSTRAACIWKQDGGELYTLLIVSLHPALICGDWRENACHVSRDWRKAKESSAFHRKAFRRHSLAEDNRQQARRCLQVQWFNEVCHDYLHIEDWKLPTGRLNRQGVSIGGTLVTISPLLVPQATQRSPAKSSLGSSSRVLPIVIELRCRSERMPCLY